MITDFPTAPLAPPATAETTAELAAFGGSPMIPKALRRTVFPVITKEDLFGLLLAQRNAPEDVVGLAAGIVCSFAIGLKFRFGYDDSLDVVGVHFVGGVVGVLLIGFLATAVMTGGADGLFFGGGFGQLGKQTLAMVVVAGYAFAMSYGLAKLIDRLMGFRLSPEDETAGVDFTQHAETAYAEGVHGHQPLRRPLFGEGRTRPDVDDD